MIYQWRPGVRLKGDAQEIGELLDRLSQQSNGLSPETLLTAATPKRSPLHKFFTWDDTEAAKLHRLEEARYIMRSVTVVVEGVSDESPPGRAFVTVKKDKQNTYQPIGQVLATPSWREQLLGQAQIEMRRFEEKYRRLPELKPVFEAMQAARDKLSKRRVRKNKVSVVVAGATRR